jgi:hypothetical protein
MCNRQILKIYVISLQKCDRHVFLHNSTVCFHENKERSITKAFDSTKKISVTHNLIISTDTKKEIQLWRANKWL